MRYLLDTNTCIYAIKSDADRCRAIRAQLEKRGTVIGPYDLQIAAQALARGLILVSHNTREFARIPGLELEDWAGR